MGEVKAELELENAVDRIILPPDLFLLGQNSNGDLNGLFDVPHERRADRSGERTAQKKGFIQRGDLFTLGHGGVFKASLSGRQFNVGRRRAVRCGERHDNHVIGEAVAYIHRDDENGPRLTVGRMPRKPD